MTAEVAIPQRYHRAIMGPKGCRIQHITREHEVQIKFPEKDDGAAGEKLAAIVGSAPTTDLFLLKQQVRRLFYMKTARSVQRSLSLANVTSSQSPGERKSVNWPKPPCW